MRVSEKEQKQETRKIENEEDARASAWAQGGGRCLKIRLMLEFREEIFF